MKWPEFIRIVAILLIIASSVIDLHDAHIQAKLLDLLPVYQHSTISYIWLPAGIINLVWLIAAMFIYLRKYSIVLVLLILSLTLYNSASILFEAVVDIFRYITNSSRLHIVGDYTDVVAIIRLLVLLYLTIINVKNLFYKYIN